MLLMGLLTPVVVLGGSEVMEAAEGTSGGERWPEGGEDTDELSGLRESDEKNNRENVKEFHTHVQSKKVTETCCQLNGF